MYRYFSTLFFILTLSFSAQAKHQNFHYEFGGNYKYEVRGSDNFRKFNSNLIIDKDVEKQIKNYKKTGIVSYLLFEDGKIKIDAKSDRYEHTSNETPENKRLLKSNSVGKSVASYIIGHAICEGYIKSVDSRLNDWPLLNNTLYNNQKLLDLLNMTAGDQNYIGYYKYVGDVVKGKAKRKRTHKQSVNLKSIKFNLDKHFQNTNKSEAIYNYSAMATNVALNYAIFKTGDNYQKLLNKIFNQHVKVKNNIYFLKNRLDESVGSARYTFYADRYDYLRIAKTMMDDWNNNTCVGKYLKTIYEQRVTKNNKKPSAKNGVYSYSKSYGGQFHFDIVGLKDRKILGMDGLGGQQVIIDFEQKKIIVINSIDRHYNWKKLVHKKLK